MAKQRPDQPGGSDHGHKHDSGGDHRRKFENDKGNASHIEIEERRFRGGLPPTPELYARARDQWNQLPGSVVRSPMDPVAGNPPTVKETKPLESPVESNEEK
ncbi:MAG: hypothetical protein ACREMY_03460 [bacterium]